MKAKIFSTGLCAVVMFAAVQGAAFAGSSEEATSATTTVAYDDSATSPNHRARPQRDTLNLVDNER